MSEYSEKELIMIKDILEGNGEKYHVKPNRKTKYVLNTPEGDKWTYDDLESARRDQYIFGGKISKAAN